MTTKALKFLENFGFSLASIDSAKIRLESFFSDHLFQTQNRIKDIITDQYWKAVS